MRERVSENTEAAFSDGGGCEPSLGRWVGERGAERGTCGPAHLPSTSVP